MGHEIVFDRPSMRYDEGLPLGTGRIGAMALGGVREAFIHLNEETGWYGGPRDRINPDAREYMPEIRRLMREGRVKEAERLAVLALTGTPETQRHFTTMGIAVLDFFGHQDADAQNYRHTLDLDTATAVKEYTLCPVRYTVEVLAAMAHQVIAVRVRASEPVLDFFAGVERGERVAQFSYGTHEDDAVLLPNGVAIRGNLGGRKGLDFFACMLGACDGELKRIGDKLVVKNAREAQLFIAMGTNFEGTDPETGSLDRAASALKAGFEAVREAHLRLWQPLYRAASVWLDRSIRPLPSMNRLFDAFANHNPAQLGVEDLSAFDDRLTVLLFHYGRYLLLASGHDCLLPAALQGLWCRDLLSIWDGKYTTNINLQMAYWPVDSANMTGCFDGYFRLAKRIRESGIEAARRMYGCRGFVLHNNTDLWADTAVQDAGTHCSYWFSGGLWIAADMFEHYRYTRDIAFLREAWPVLRDAALFALDFMEEDEAGELVMGVTSSPENFYFSAAGERVSFCSMTAMDSQLIALAFRNCLSALSELGGAEAPDGFGDSLLSALKRLAPTRIGSDGAIAEWDGAYREAEPMHRHQSHLIGAYPYDQITRRDGELFKAVGVSIDKRRRNGGCNTGWSRAWAGGIYARLNRGDDARDMISQMARLSGQPNLICCCNIGRAPKLMEDAMPMQIDGNLGTVQAVIEMLLHSHDGEIVLLPALPKSWHSGGFSGLVARGNVVVGAEWSDGQLTRATLEPRVEGEICVLAAPRMRVAGEGTVLETGADGRACWMGRAGARYEIVR